jgi:hypothetical protein
MLLFLIVVIEVVVCIGLVLVQNFIKIRHWVQIRLLGTDTNAQASLIIHSVLYRINLCEHRR